MNSRIYELIDIKQKINSLRLKNVNVNYLESKLNEIFIEDEEYLYRDKVDELNNLICIYEKIVECLMICNKTSNELMTFPSYKLDENITKILEIIEDTKEYYNVWEDNNYIAKRIYKVIFDIMVEEFVQGKKSKIWLYFENSDINKKYFVASIKDELDNIKDNQHIFGDEAVNIINYSDLRNEYEEKKMEVIKELIEYFGDSEIKEEVNQEAHRIINSIKINDNKIREHLAEKELVVKKLDIIKRKLNKKKKELLVRLTSISLSFGILFGGVVLSKNVAEKNNLKKCYKGNVYSYSNIYGNREEVKLFNVSDNPVSNTVVNEYGPIIDGRRSYTTYDVSSANLDNIEDYDMLNLSEYSKKSDYASSFYINGESDLEYSEIVDTQIDTTNVYEVIDENGFYLSFFIYILILLGVLEPSFTVYSILARRKAKNRPVITLGVFYNICSLLARNATGLNIIQLTNKYLKKEDLILTNIEVLDETFNYLLERDLKLKEEFKKLYYQYLYLLDNKDKLLLEANLEDTSKVFSKKLLKENK